MSSLTYAVVFMVAWLGYTSASHKGISYREYVHDRMLKYKYDKLIAKLETERSQRAYEQVCYGEMGCFDNAAPYNNILGQVPEDPAVLGTKFFLHTRSSSTAQEVHYSDQNTITSSYFDPTRKTKFVMHGFTGKADMDWPNAIISETLAKEDVNMIAVDWERGAQGPDYFQAVANCRIVGAEIALFINKLTEWTELQYTDVTLIGFSLGAQVAGYAGERLSGLGKIIGLDPAGPFFEDQDIKIRLDPTDAANVVVLHTNGGSTFLGYAGIEQECGHVDMYPNGGSIQPNCGSPLESAVAAIFSMEFEKFFDYVSCNHARAPWIYVEDIKEDFWGLHGFGCHSHESFIGGKCDNYGMTNVKDMENYSYRGTAYLDTFDETHGKYTGTHFRVKVVIGDDEPYGAIYATLNFNTDDSKTIQLTDDEEIATDDSASGVVLVDRDCESVVTVDIEYQKGFWSWWWNYNTMEVTEINVLNYDNANTWTCTDVKKIDDGETVSFTMSPV